MCPTPVALAVAGVLSCTAGFARGSLEGWLAGWVVPWEGTSGCCPTAKIRFDILFTTKVCNNSAKLGCEIVLISKFFSLLW